MDNLATMNKNKTKRKHGDCSDNDEKKDLFSAVEKNLNKQLKLINNIQQRQQWITACNNTIECLKQLSEQDCSTGFKQRMLAMIVRINCMKERVKYSMWSFGSGLRREDPSSSSSSSITESTSALPSTSTPSSSFLRWQNVESAFKSRITTGMIANIQHIDPLQFLLDCKKIIMKNVRLKILKHHCIKVNTTFNAEFIMTHIVNENNGNNVSIVKEKTDIKSFTTANVMLLPMTDLEKWYSQDVVKRTLISLEEYQERDSGWALSKIINILVNVNHCTPMSGANYITLPREIQLKHAVVTVQSNDDACFAWAVVSALYPVKKNSNRITSYPHYTTVLNLKGIKFPMSLNQIPTFERLNHVTINVYLLKLCKGKYETLPLQLSAQENKNDTNDYQHIDLLLFEDESAKNRGFHDNWHYAWIKNFSRLMSNQFSKNEHIKHICNRCLHYFNSKAKLRSHRNDCINMYHSKISLPKNSKDGIPCVKFKNNYRRTALPITIYADFECLLQTKNDYHETDTFYQYQQHIPYSVGYYLHCNNDRIPSRYSSYRGDKCAEWFVNELRTVINDISEMYANPLKMIFNETDQYDFMFATYCHICKKEFETDSTIVRDHCHLTGRYRGAAHVACNLNWQDYKIIPIIFHNLTNYDAHFLIEEIASKLGKRVKVIATTIEKYIAIMKHINIYVGEKQICIQLNFIDSYRFLNASLSKLVGTLKNTDMKNLREHFHNIDDESFSLLMRKGVFPYEYVNKWERLDETKLPDYQAFYSTLSKSNISMEEYEYAKIVWEKFDIQTLGEYSDLYLKTDVLLLADVFETFRLSCLKSYGLDPAYYFTVSGYAWDVMLKTTKIELQLLTDIDMVMFIERGIRGGLSQCSHRHAKANNKYMNELYDPQKESIYLMYYDVNNLYGWAMAQPLPYQNFQWLQNIDNFNVTTISDDSPTGYILEVDLEYPKEIHDWHKDLPFCSKHDRSKDKKYNKKLLATLHNKSNYVIHYRVLKQCLQNGLKLLKIHRILQFDQSAWLQHYIELNTQLRTEAQTDFEMNLYKLMINAVFGKTIENVHNHIDVKLLTTWEGRYGAKSYIAKPNFHRRVIFNSNFVGIHMKKLEVLMNKPIYVGMSILDLSKICLYDFHYSYMKPLFKDTCQILYTDTDSLIYQIKTQNIYEIMKKDIQRFDTSDYKETNVFNMPRVNRKKIGLMKDECKGLIISEFVGLRAKMYAFKVYGEYEVKRAKGVSTHIVNREITFNDYLEVLQTHGFITKRQNCIRSKLHKVYTISEQKVALQSNDDKRYVTSDNVNTLPWDHYAIPENEDL